VLLGLHGCLTGQFHLDLLLLDVLKSLDLLLFVHLTLPTIELRGVTHIHLEVTEDLRVLSFLDF
jgi:hypothetical protein